MTTPGEMSEAEAQVLREAAKAAQPTGDAGGGAGGGIDATDDLVPPATGPSG